MAIKSVTVVGGGLAGSEAAWQIARRGVPVTLYEMRPVIETPVHRTGNLAELVCSNSLKSLDLSTAHGLLKEEMRQVGSLIVETAIQNRVPAGSALAVDRDGFPQAITAAIEQQPGITIVREEVQEIPADDIVILAVGPLVSDKLATAIASLVGQGYLYFYDAIAPVVAVDSIDRSIVFSASRYDKGDGDDYLNCPFTNEQYQNFIDALLSAEQAELHEMDKTSYFEGCIPIEEIARRGRESLSFGPMKPVGLIDPATGERPYAVVQLRQDNLAAEHYSMVGLQTQMRQAEQRRVFSLIPGLANANFVRLGQVHRNCYINAPTVLDADLQMRTRPGMFFAGQISGVEGYTESAATGLLAGISAARLALGQEAVTAPKETMIGALCHYISHSPAKGYQPANATLGLLPPPPRGLRKRRERRIARTNSALKKWNQWIADSGILLTETAK
jgi:methylenetetrahydrofolate--tRNA-(uracil-5-)-methyltransferase